MLPGKVADVIGCVHGAVEKLLLLARNGSAGLARRGPPCPRDRLGRQISVPGKMAVPVCYLEAIAN